MDESPGRVPAMIMLAGLACMLLLIACSCASDFDLPPRDYHKANPGNQQLVAVGSGDGSGDISDVGSIVGSPDLFAQAQKPMTISVPSLTTVSTGTATTGNTGSGGTTLTTTGTGVTGLQSGLATKSTGSVLLTSKGAVTTSSRKTGTVLGTGSLQTGSKGSTKSANLTGTTVASNPQKTCTGINCSVKSGISLDSGIAAVGGKVSKGSGGTTAKCPADKPVQTCNTNSLTGKTECTCSALTAVPATDPHAGQKWCEPIKCYRSEITANGKKLVMTGVAGGEWVGADADCPDCSSKAGPGSAPSASQAFCDSFTGVEKEQCEKCGSTNQTEFFICKAANSGYYNTGLYR